MSTPYLGEIRMFGGNFEINGWAFCDGRLLPISQFDTLFNLIGTTYGGDGQTTFALPDLRSRFPVHMGTSSLGTPYVIGEKSGTETVTLTLNQIPLHSHVPGVNNAGGADNPTNNVWGKSTTGKPYANVPGGVLVSMNNTTMVQNSGGNQPHDNMHPFLVINFIISLFGVFPTQN